MTLSSLRSHRFFPAYVCLISLFLLLSVAAFAQNNTSISGVVRDPQDKVVPNAAVTITNTANGSVRSQKTSATGSYNFDLLTPGDYRIEAQAPGFRKTVLENVHALIAKPTDLDIKLQVGGSAEEITVSAEGGQVLVNTQDAAVGNNFVSSQITQLPLEARNVLALVTLEAGVTKDGYVAGARADQSNVTLDGVDINEAQSSAIGDNSRDVVNGTTTPNAEKGPVLRLNSEAVEEFRVGTTTTNASSARSSGAQIALVTKSGSNKFHGAAFESHRNTIFTANDYFNNNTGTPRPTLIRNTFGGAIGGPIVKNKAFFFYSYEGRRDASQQAVSNIVPLANVGQGTVRFHTCVQVTNPDGSTSCPQGALSQVTTAEIQQIFPDIGGINSTAQQALADAAAQYPSNDPSIGDGLNTGGYRFNSAVPISLNSMAAKLDFNLTSHQTMFIRGNYVFDHYTGTKYLANSPATSEWDHPLGFAIGHTWTIGNNIVNNARFGLTRQAFSQQGDTVGNYIRFRFLFSPTNASRSLDRVTPVYNWVDDLSWVKGKHTLQFGVNITKQNNIRTNYANAWDDATTNPSFYGTGTVRNPLNNYVAARDSSGGNTVQVYSGDKAAAENAITALIGRFTQYTANFNYTHDNNLVPSGTPTHRNFAGQGYEFYAQDIWKVSESLTVTAGLRYSLWRPIYETNGFETAPDIQLSEYLARRAAGAAIGQAYADPITILQSGPANGAPPMYNWDKTNFQPRIAIAYSPHSDSGGLFSKLFGKAGESVFRGGFSLNGDYFGQALASFFDTNNTLGYGSSTTISANTYNVGCTPYQSPSNKYFGAPGTCSGTKNLGPLFTSYNQDVRGLPGITVVPSISFPQMTPADNSARIEASLDGALVTPKSYSWSFTYERQLPKGIVVSASYLGRAGRNLLLQRDAMQLINLTDPSSKTDWYTAGTMLAKLYNQHAGIDSNGDFTNPAAIPTIPYFENLFPGLAANLGYDPADFGVTALTATQAAYADLNDEGGDFTTMQLDIDTLSNVGPNAFYNPQYGALTAYSTVGNSNYNAFAFTVRERLNTLTLDFNYTYSHSLDDASGLQAAVSYDGSSFILNPFRQRDNYASSDFDMRHQININSVWQLPFGHGKTFLSGVGKVANGFIGGWQLSNIFRWNTGMPIGFYDAPGVFDDARWATNWEVQSNGVPLQQISTCPTRGATPKLFGCNTKEAYQSFRNAYPGETGPRNLFRVPGYVTLDFGLGKTFNLSGISTKIPEGQTLQFRWEVFNATNTQHFGNFDGSRTGFGLSLFPSENDPPSNWSNFTAIQGSPRVMQFTLRYAF
jgi:hypothetical protein